MRQAFFFEDSPEVNFLGHQFAEIYKDRIYDSILKGKNNLTIIEVGGNLGLSTYYFSKFAKQVIVLEPALSHFDCLSMMLEFNKITNVKPIRKALWIENTTLPLYHNQNKTMDSLHQNVHDNSEQPEKVETITLTDLLTQEKIEHVDFLNLDVEGSEIEILSHPTFRENAEKIDAIMVERHAWSGRHPNQLNEALKDIGFKLETIPSSADILVGKRI